MSDFPNSGTLSRNKSKKPGTKWPDANGKCHVTCPACQHESEYVIAGWLREGKSKFTALKFTEKSIEDKRKADAIAKKSGLAVAAPSETPASAPATSETPEEPKTEVPF